MPPVWLCNDSVVETGGRPLEDRTETVLFEPVNAERSTGNGLSPVSDGRVSDRATGKIGCEIEADTIGMFFVRQIGQVSARTADPHFKHLLTVSDVLKDIPRIKYFSRVKQHGRERNVRR